MSHIDHSSPLSPLRHSPLPLDLPPASNTSYVVLIGAIKSVTLLSMILARGVFGTRKLSGGGHLERTQCIPHDGYIFDTIHLLYASACRMMTMIPSECASKMASIICLSFPSLPIDPFYSHNNESVIFSHLGIRTHPSGTSDNSPARSFRTRRPRRPIQREGSNVEGLGTRGLRRSSSHALPNVSCGPLFAERPCSPGLLSGATAVEGVGEIGRKKRKGRTY